MKLQWIKELSMGDQLRVYTDHIEIGPVSLEFGRPVTKEDMEAICTIYAMGLAARSRYMSKALQQLLAGMEPVEIIGFKENTDES